MASALSSWSSPSCWSSSSPVSLPTPCLTLPLSRSTAPPNDGAVRSSSAMVLLRSSSLVGRPSSRPARRGPGGPVVVGPDVAARQHGDDDADDGEGEVEPVVLPVEREEVPRLADRHEAV